ncbi:MAG TPA: hypothetical protein VMR46_00545 [Candidatus Paceibacterota bacterium]|nr:hypothetical protein [Candidatus Paceibacterota bacterium]
MDTLLVVIFLASLVALVVGSIKPRFVRMSSSKHVRYVFGGIAGASFVILGLTSLSSPSTVTQAAAIVPATPVLSSAQTSAIESAVQSVVASKLKGAATYEGTTINNAGAVSVNLGVPANFLGVDESVVAGLTGPYTVPLFSSVFGQGYPVSSLTVTYFATTTASQNAPLIAYTIDQKTYAGTDWTDPAQADPLSLCETLQTAHGTGADTNAQCTETPSSSAPLSPQQKAEAAVQAQLNSQATLGDVEIDSDQAVPPGTDNVTVDLNLSEELDDNSIITDTGLLSTAIFQHVFPVDSDFTDVLIRYYGQTTDQYGNSKTSMIMSYDMDLGTFSQINWSGLSAIGNDVHMCAFLREVDSTMAESNPNKEYIGCVVLPSDLRTAEDAIETGNPQYGDIPQYGSQ